MSPNSSPPIILLDRLLPKLRLPIILVSLGLIIYYTVYLVFQVPYYGFTFIWRPDNVATVAAFEPYEDPPAGQYLQKEDVIKRIDDKPVLNIDWTPLFTVLKASYKYTVQREDQILTFEIPVASPNFAAIAERVTAGTVALIIWAIAGLIILFATPKNRDAWWVGIIFLGIAISLAASEASLQGVPFARLGSEPLLPIIIVGFLSIALLPRINPPTRRERTIFAILLTLAAILGLMLLWDIFYLNPKGSSFELITGVSLYHHLLFAFLGLGGLAYIIILIIRSWRLPQLHLRQQSRILLVFTTLAILPGILLTLLPVAVSGSLILPWIVFIALLSLIPAGYGYIIYRRKYLGLDFFVSRTLTGLLMGLALLVAYGVVLGLLRRQSPQQLVEPLSGYLALVVGLAVVPFTGKASRQSIHMLIFGPHVPYEETIARFTTNLADDPQISTLRCVLHDLTNVLQVRQAALLLVHGEDRLILVERIGIERLQPVSLNKLKSIPSTPIRRSNPDISVASHLLDGYPWAELMLFLRVGDRPVGLLLLGAPVPSGYFNGQQVNYISQVGNVMAVAIEAIQLFESSREMSSEMMVIRETERAQLAARIHDDPIQRISVVMNGLAALENHINLPEVEVSNALRIHRETLREAARQLREICAGLYPPTLEQGIQLAIRDMARNFAMKTKISVDLTVDVPDNLIISHRVTTAVYHVLTETLNNIEKHAQATHVWIEFTYQKEQLQLIVADNGQGNTLASMSASALIRARHFGIAGMYNWASLAHGELHFGQRAERGTVVTLQLPLEVGSNGG